MYGTVARMKVKPGKLQELISQMPESGRRPDGYTGELVYQMDNDPNTVMLVVLFNDKASYQANANDPEMNKDYERYRALLDADPEWNDGEIVHSVLP